MVRDPKYHPPSSERATCFDPSKVQQMVPTHTIKLSKLLSQTVHRHLTEGLTPHARLLCYSSNPRRGAFYVAASLMWLHQRSSNDGKQQKRP